jgi:hypothetical protein
MINSEVGVRPLRRSLCSQHEYIHIKKMKKKYLKCVKDDEIVMFIYIYQPKKMIPNKINNKKIKIKFKK